MTRTALKIVTKHSIAIPYDDARGLKLITSKKDQLMHAAVKYIRDGKDGSRNDRLRTASSASGVPLNLLEIEASR